MQTASLMNHLMMNSTNPVPVVGMGLTLLKWTDRSAATIVRVHPGGKKFWAVSDEATRTDKNGMSDAQSYEYTPGTGPEFEVKLFKKGWKAFGPSGTPVSLGHRNAYHDYSF